MNVSPIKVWLPRHAARRGYSMVELAVVLGVMGLILGGVWALVSRLQQTAKTHLTVAQIVLINKNIRSYYQTRPCMLAGDQTVVPLLTATPPVFPREMVRGAAVVHQWNGTVQALGGAAACNYAFTLQFNGLPPDICVELLPLLTAAGEVSRGLQAATLNAVPLGALPPNPSTIIGTAAGRCGENATAQVALTYKLRLAD
jgi:hypothetical protein